MHEANRTLQEHPPLQHLYHMGGRDYPENTFHLIHYLIDNQPEPEIWCPRRAEEILDVVITGARRTQRQAQHGAPIVLPNAPTPATDDRDGIQHQQTPT